MIMKSPTCKSVEMAPQELVEIRSSHPKKAARYPSHEW